MEDYVCLGSMKTVYKNLMVFFLYEEFETNFRFQKLSVKIPYGGIMGYGMKYEVLNKCCFLLLSVETTQSSTT